jgi:hypothetical protein
VSARPIIRGCKIIIPTNSTLTALGQSMQYQDHQDLSSDRVNFHCIDHDGRSFSEFYILALSSPWGLLLNSMCSKSPSTSPHPQGLQLGLQLQPEVAGKICQRRLHIRVCAQLGKIVDREQRPSNQSQDVFNTRTIP